eukprot:scaffold9095_cov58-Cylindrotheca_fusiformis.AAC.1
METCDANSTNVIWQESKSRQRGRSRRASFGNHKSSVLELIPPTTARCLAELWDWAVLSRMILLEGMRNVQLGIVSKSHDDSKATSGSAGENSRCLHASARKRKNSMQCYQVEAEWKNGNLVIMQARELFLVVGKRIRKCCSQECPTSICISLGSLWKFVKTTSRCLVVFDRKDSHRLGLGCQAEGFKYDDEIE